MDNTFDDMQKAVRQARAVRTAVRAHGDAMLELLDGSLEGLSTYRLAKLKRQLQRFNAHTKEWTA